MLITITLIINCFTFKKALIVLLMVFVCFVNYLCFCVVLLALVFHGNSEILGLQTCDLDCKLSEDIKINSCTYICIYNRELVLRLFDKSRDILPYVFLFQFITPFFVFLRFSNECRNGWRWESFGSDASSILVSQLTTSFVYLTIIYYSTSFDF